MDVSHDHADFGPQTPLVGSEGQLVLTSTNTQTFTQEDSTKKRINHKDFQLSTALI
jgi:hypothetical protein